MPSRLQVRASFTTVAVLFGVLSSPSRATTFHSNVSDLLVGNFQTFKWPPVLSKKQKKKITNERTIEFEVGASASIDSETSAYYSQQWPEQYGVATQVLVDRFQQTPAPTPQLTYTSPFYRLATGAFLAQAGTIESQTALQGRASATLNYRAKVTITAAKALAARPYFLEFAIPQHTQQAQTAYDLIPGDNGGTYLYMTPKSAQGRSAVEVYIDDLPAWQSERIYTFPTVPTARPHNAFDVLNTAWGKGDNGDCALLFLGNLKGQRTFVINLVIRTDASVDSTKCGRQPPPFNGPATKICQSERQKLDLVPTGTGGLAFDFQVYAQ